MAGSVDLEWSDDALADLIGSRRFCTTSLRSLRLSLLARSSRERNRQLDRPGICDPPSGARRLDSPRHPGRSEATYLVETGVTDVARKPTPIIDTDYNEESLFIRHAYFLVRTIRMAR